MGTQTRSFIGIALAVLLFLTALSFVDPNVNIPVISQTVCSLKGDAWYGGGLMGSPGCYRPW